MKYLLILIFSSIIGLAGYYAGCQNTPASTCEDYKFYDTVTDENGRVIQLYAKETPPQEINL